MPKLHVPHKRFFLLFPESMTGGFLRYTDVVSYEWDHRSTVTRCTQIDYWLTCLWFLCSPGIALSIMGIFIYVSIFPSIFSITSRRLIFIYITWTLLLHNLPYSGGSKEYFRVCICEFPALLTWPLMGSILSSYILTLRHQPTIRGSAMEALVPGCTLPCTL